MGIRIRSNGDIEIDESQWKSYFLERYDQLEAKVRIAEKQLTVERLYAFLLETNNDLDHFGTFKVIKNGYYADLKIEKL